MFELAAVTHPYTYVCLFSFLLSLSITVHAAHNLRSEVRRSFLLFSGSTAYWCGVTVLHLILVPSPISILNHTGLLVAATGMTWGWFRFSLTYLSINLSRRTELILLTVLVGVTLIEIVLFLLGNGGNPVYIRTGGVSVINLQQSGPWFTVVYLLVLSAYATPAVGAVLWETFDTSEVTDSASVLVSTTGVITLIAGAVDFFAVHPYPHVAISPAIVSLGVALLWFEANTTGLAPRA